MGNIKISVGSQNEIKIQAVEIVASTIFGQKVEIQSLDVPSGIVSNPIDNDEAIKGAQQRALKSQAETDADFGVGIEGNLFQQSDRWFLTTWIVVVDGKTKKEFMSQGIAVEVSQKEVVDQIHPDKPLGDIFKALPDHCGYAQFGTPMGYLTGNVFDRTRALTVALEACFAQVKRAMEIQSNS